MIFGNDRNQLRRFYIDSWNKQQAGEPLEPMETMVANVVGQHPEYHALLADPDTALANDFPPEQGEGNPFLHMGMHIAIQEQLTTDRPHGIMASYQTLKMRLGDPHQVEHQIIECLGQSLWEAQRSGTAPDERAYLECIQRL